MATLCHQRLLQRSLSCHLTQSFLFSNATTSVCHCGVLLGQAGSKSSLGIYAERQQAYVHPFHSSVELIKTQKRQVRAQHLLLRPSP